MAVLDSDCIVQYLRGNPKAVDFVRTIKRETHALKTTSFTVSELYYGAFISSQSAKSLRDVKDILERFEILDFTADCALLHAQITANLRNKGKPIGAVDPFIASVVLANAETLVTRNIDHFKNIERLPLINWHSASTE